MQFALFTVLGIVLYVVSDRILLALERRAGRVYEHRSLVFFAILLTLAITTFGIVQRLVPTP